MVSFEPARDRTYIKTCATRSLIRVLADRMCIRQPCGYPKRDKREPMAYLVAVQADLRLDLSHRS